MTFVFLKIFLIREFMDINNQLDSSNIPMYLWNFYDDFIAVFMVMHLANAIYSYT